MTVYSLSVLPVCHIFSNSWTKWPGFDVQQTKATGRIPLTWMIHFETSRWSTQHSLSLPKLPKSAGLSTEPAGKALPHRDWQSNSSPVWSWGKNRRKEEIKEKCLLKLVHINRLESAGGGRGIRHTDKYWMREIGRRQEGIESAVRKRLTPCWWFIWSSGE